LVVYSVDTLVMGRKREWNYRTVRLSGGNEFAHLIWPTLIV
jgi:hypothetical protein